MCHTHLLTCVQKSEIGEPLKRAFGHVWVMKGYKAARKSYSAGNVDQSGILGQFSGFLTINFTQYGSHFQFLTHKTSDLIEKTSSELDLAPSK
mmetsp:Transcript_48037/g.85756  ORF Transcript_48037/g.85756 Transcript_48037/m.85756 type:complete len:93 (+) Transcript_48037:818-1096(+)